jgi:hypothetical protein
MPHQKARQHAPRARWRPAGRARAAPAAPRGPTAGTPSGRPRRAEGRCALHRARCRGAHRAGPWAAARAGTGRLQVGAVTYNCVCLLLYAGNKHTHTHKAVYMGVVTHNPHVNSFVLGPAVINTHTPHTHVHTPMYTRKVKGGPG